MRTIWDADKKNIYTFFRNLYSYLTPGGELTIRSLLYCLLTLITLHIQGQIESFDKDFTQVSIDQGLSNTIIIDIEQDTNGFMWFATSDGLNQFDGYNFKVFKKGNSPTSLSDHYQNDLFVDSRGIFWITTVQHGIDVYDINKKRHYNTLNNYYKGRKFPFTSVCKTLYDS
jgi:ligand-binding sensor domain-containing protein